MRVPPKDGRSKETISSSASTTRSSTHCFLLFILSFLSPSPLFFSSFLHYNKQTATQPTNLPTTNYCHTTLAIQLSCCPSEPNQLSLSLFISLSLFLFSYSLSLSFLSHCIHLSLSLFLSLSLSFPRKDTNNYPISFSFFSPSSSFLTPQHSPAAPLYLSLASYSQQPKKNTHIQQQSTSSPF